MKKIRFIALLSCFLLVITGFTTMPDIEEKATKSTKVLATDYRKNEHWLNIPNRVNKEIDVFYLYPSAWTKVTAAFEYYIEHYNNGRPLRLQLLKGKIL